MSKQHIANMLKHLTNQDHEAAAEEFSKYSTEKTQEIIARLNADSNPDPAEPVQPDPAPVDPVDPVDPLEPKPE